eukprot:scaffold33786_cov32-Tisochrysis_lutea.AAC.5
MIARKVGGHMQRYAPAAVGHRARQLAPEATPSLRGNDATSGAPARDYGNAVASRLVPLG